MLFPALASHYHLCKEDKGWRKGGASMLSSCHQCREGWSLHIAVIKLLLPREWRKEEAQWGVGIIGTSVIGIVSLVLLCCLPESLGLHWSHWGMLLWGTSGSEQASGRVPCDVPVWVYTDSGPVYKQVPVLALCVHAWVFFSSLPSPDAAVKPRYGVSSSNSEEQSLIVGTWRHFSVHQSTGIMWLGCLMDSKFRSLS